jgi:glucose/arabinose dehydrogenase
MTRIVLLAGIGIGITAAIALFFVFMSGTILENGVSGPKLSDPYEQSMEIETVAEGLSLPTSMEFVDNGNILVLDKDYGTVHLVSSLNGTLEKEPVLKLEVENEAERGLLGVAILNDNMKFIHDPTYETLFSLIK